MRDRVLVYGSFVTFFVGVLAIIALASNASRHYALIVWSLGFALIFGSWVMWDRSRRGSKTRK